MYIVYIYCEYTFIVCMRFLLGRVPKLCFEMENVRFGSTCFALLHAPGPGVNEVQRAILSRSSSSKQLRRADVYDIYQLVHESGP